MDTPNTNKLWLRWTLNCALGELTGIGVAGAIAYAVNTAIGEPQTFAAKISVLLAMMLAGAIEGTLLGFFQWRVLRVKFPALPQKEWLLYTVAIAVLGWFLGMLPSLFFIPQHTATATQESSVDLSSPGLFALFVVGAGLSLGALFGLFQWFALRRYALRAGLWIWANALGWGLGMGWIYLFASLPTSETTLTFNVLMGVCGGLLAGLSVGAVTGIFLVKLQGHADRHYYL